MILDVEKLISNLSHLDENALNEILDSRDSDPFESKWLELYKSVRAREKYPDIKAIFIELSNSTNYHEIVSYIADDLNLIHSANVDRFKNDFLEILEKSYANGVVPSNEACT